MQFNKQNLAIVKLKSHRQIEEVNLATLMPQETIHLMAGSTNPTIQGVKLANGLISGEIKPETPEAVQLLTKAYQDNNINLVVDERSFVEFDHELPSCYLQNSILAARGNSKINNVQMQNSKIIANDAKIHNSVFNKSRIRTQGDIHNSNLNHVWLDNKHETITNSTLDYVQIRNCNFDNLSAKGGLYQHSIINHGVFWISNQSLLYQINATNVRLENRSTKLDDLKNTFRKKVPLKIDDDTIAFSQFNNTLMMHDKYSSYTITNSTFENTIMYSGLNSKHGNVHGKTPAAPIILDKTELANADLISDYPVGYNLAGGLDSISNSIKNCHLKNLDAELHNGALLNKNSDLIKKISHCTELHYELNNGDQMFQYYVDLKKQLDADPAEILMPFGDHELLREKEDKHNDPESANS